MVASILGVARLSQPNASQNKFPPCVSFGGSESHFRAHKNNPAETAVLAPVEGSAQSELAFFKLLATHHKQAKNSTMAVSRNSRVTARSSPGRNI